MSGSGEQAFDEVAGEYQQKALVQHRAAKKLLALAEVREGEDVLDVACGPGHITDALRSLTTGRVLGTDISEGMLNEARQQYPRLEFRHIAAEDLDYAGEFDLVFCNSSLQWFEHPDRALAAMFRALRRGGRLALACPTAWGLFAQAVDSVTQYPEIAPVFKHWRNPWFVLPDLAGYRALAEGAGFATRQAELAEETETLALERAYQVYLSGAANGYTGRMYYAEDFPETYVREFNAGVRRVLEAQAVAGKVAVTFTRLFYLGEKK
ncbi:MAG: methyltransferase domain-containing protein [Candidatus Firestonebacteria bacterium]|nr:methyltransferase domain-containing protein [Candidatus Firestonebacteria bacterium]